MRVRVCHGKLYPQHQYEEFVDRRVVSRSIISPVRWPMPCMPILDSRTNEARNSARAFGF
jgi:hypothetical protein